MAKIINLSEHACNGDQSLCLTVRTTPRRFVGREIYRAKLGFVATLPNCKCLAGFYATEDEAAAAQDEVLRS